MIVDPAIGKRSTNQKKTALGSNSRVWKQESLVKGLREFGSEAVIDAEMGKNEGSLERCG